MKKTYINNLNFEIIAKQIWWFLTQLHSIDINKFKDLLDLDFKNHYSFQDWYINYLIEEYKKIEYIFSQEDFKKIIDYIIDSKKYTINYSAITHYDFQWKNIIFSKEKNNIQWVIDFSNTAIYDPAVDFVWLL